MDSPRCVRCHDIIGVYEPTVVILPDGGKRTGSPLSLGPELADPWNTVIHERCPPTPQDDSRQLDMD
jgi:hypothetical protein